MTSLTLLMPGLGSGVTEAGARHRRITVQLRSGETGACNQVNLDFDE